jgi:uncharacterized protein (DUF2147 family)
MKTILRIVAIGGMLTIGDVALADPSGTWLTEQGRARVRIADCGGTLCGTIVGLKEPNDPDTGKPKLDKNNTDASKRTRPLIGVAMVFGLKPDGANKWSAQVYNPDDGKTYSGNIIEQGANALKMEGCVLGGLICKGQTWTRAN